MHSLVLILFQRWTVSVKVTSEEAPWVGTGRRTIPLYVIRDKQIKKYIKKRGLEAQTELENLGRHRTDKNNPQTILHQFKQDVRCEAIARQKKMVPTIIRDMQVTKAALTAALNEQVEETHISETQKREIVTLTERLDKLEKKQHQQIRMDIRTKNRVEGETICKGWCRLGKEKTPRDIIYALKKKSRPTNDQGEETYEKNSKKMATLAQNYHEELQDKDRELDQQKREHC